MYVRNRARVNRVKQNNILLRAKLPASPVSLLTVSMMMTMMRTESTDDGCSLQTFIIFFIKTRFYLFSCQRFLI